MRFKPLMPSKKKQAESPIFTGSGPNLRVHYGSLSSYSQPQSGYAQWESAVDSGMVSGYRPAQHNKPGLAGFMQRVQNMFNGFRGIPPPGSTTQQGSPSAAEPAVYQFELYQLRYDRRAMIEECRRMYADDPRIRQSINQYCEEAVRDGFNIVIHKSSMSKERFKIVQQCKMDIERALNPQLDGVGKMLLVEGDSFMQWVVDPASRRIVEAARMPTSSMERVSDDADEFPDPERAFVQVGIMTNAEVAHFNQALMTHMRWEWIPGNKYGEPTIIAVRRQWRLLKLQEEAQARRRMIRASQHIIWNIGTKEKMAEAADVQDFKAKNGFVEGNRDQWDPTEVGRDFFGNGALSAQVLEGDQTVHNIEDIEYTQDVMMSGLPTPAALLPVAAKNINRDVLKDQRAQWLLSTKRLSNKLRDELVSYGFELALLLQGIMPDEIEYTIHFSESAVETAKEIIDRVLSLRQNTLGKGPNAIPDPQITTLQVQQLLSEVLGIKDPEAAEKGLLAESGKWMDQYGKIMEMRTPEPTSPAPSLSGNKRPSSGRPLGGKRPSAAKDAEVGIVLDEFVLEYLPTVMGDEDNLTEPDLADYAGTNFEPKWAGYGNPSSLWWHSYASGPDDKDCIAYKQSEPNT